MRTLSLTALLFVATTAFAANPIQIENGKAGDPNWAASPEARDQIEGYASATSVDRGDTINLYVRTDEPAYTIEIYRFGWYGGAGARKMAGPISRIGNSQGPAAIPAPNATTGFVECNWTDPYSLTIPRTADPTHWASGAYVARLTAGTSLTRKFIYFVVRDDKRRSEHHFQSSATTLQAYNNWGGRSLYSFNSCGATAWRDGCPTGGGTAANVVSFNRPYAGGAGTGDFLWGWEYNMVRFLEREGFDLTYSTNVDTHQRGELLLNHRDFLSIGHDEYWSKAMRDNVEYARDHGVPLGFFSANSAYWQIRFEPDRFGVPDRTMVAYRSLALTGDPYAIDRDPSNDHLITTKWRNAPVNRPEAALIGVQYIYDELVLRGDMIIDDVTSAPWVFAGTGATPGSTIPGVLGYEIDALDASSPPGIIRLAHSPFLNKKINPPPTQYSDMTLYTASSGALVFATGTIQWSWALDDWNLRAHVTPVSALAQEITRNVLKKFAPDCQWSISPGSSSVNAASGTGTITVKPASSACSWNPWTTASWLRVTQGEGATGNGTLTYSYDRNGGAARSATLMIGTQAFTLNQAACSLTLSKTAKLTRAAATDRVTVTATGGCPWTASANDTWLTITSATSGSGNGTVTYSVAANPGADRDGVLTIGGIAVMIHQSGTNAPPNAPARSIRRSPPSR